MSEPPLPPRASLMDLLERYRVGSSDSAIYGDTTSQDTGGSFSHLSCVPIDTGVNKDPASEEDVALYKGRGFGVSKYDPELGSNASGDSDGGAPLTYECAMRYIAIAYKTKEATLKKFGKTKEATVAIEKEMKAFTKPAAAISALEDRQLYSFAPLDSSAQINRSFSMDPNSDDEVLLYRGRDFGIPKDAPEPDSDAFGDSHGGVPLTYNAALKYLARIEEAHGAAQRDLAKAEKVKDLALKELAKAKKPEISTAEKVEKASTAQVRLVGWLEDTNNRALRRNDSEILDELRAMLQRAGYDISNYRHPAIEPIESGGSGESDMPSVDLNRLQEAKISIKKKLEDIGTEDAAALQKLADLVKAYAKTAAQSSKQSEHSRSLSGAAGVSTVIDEEEGGNNSGGGVEASEGGNLGRGLKIAPSDYPGGGTLGRGLTAALPDYPEGFTLGCGLTAALSDYPRGGTLGRGLTAVLSDYPGDSILGRGPPAALSGYPEGGTLGSGPTAALLSDVAPSKTNSTIVVNDWSSAEQASSPREVAIGYDGIFDKRSPSVAAKVSPSIVLSDEATPGPPSTSVVVSTTTHLLHSAQSVNSSGHYESWSVNQLLDLGNTIRDLLKTGSVIPDDDIETLDSNLVEILEHEPAGKVSIDFTTIVASRFDKVISALIDAKKSSQPASDVFNDVIHKALLVERSWHMRFQDRFFDIDRERAAAMVRPGGLLMHVTLGSSSDAIGPWWIARKRIPGAGTDVLQFNVGQWWPNLACAYRDGIVNSMTGTDKYDAHEITAAVLVKGVEAFDEKSGCMRYVLEGPLKEMQLHLQENVGKEIRILRGYKLNSQDAPVAGIRYDGIYFLRRYGHKSVTDTKKSIYSTALWYERVDGQKGLDDYASDVLAPSRMDDWKMYKKIEDEEYKKRCDEKVYRAWRAKEDEEEKERKEWQRREEFSKHLKDRKN